MSPSPSASLLGSGAIHLPDERCTSYPITLDVKYTVLDLRGVQRLGSGRTVNIGTRSVLLEAKDPLPSQGLMELFIDWPVLLGGRVPLKLVMRGKIVWVDGRRVAIATTQHEFRTAANGQLRKAANCG